MTERHDPSFADDTSSRPSSPSSSSKAVQKALPAAVSSAAPVRSERRAPDDHVTEVAPGILRIMLPFDAPGLGHVNCYALEDDGGIALVDPGVADGVSHRVLAERLDEAGLDITRVHTCVITHSHFDHYGGVARMRLLDTVRPVDVLAHDRFGHVWFDTYDHVGEDADALELNDPAELDAIARFEALSKRYTRRTKWGSENHPIPPELLRRWTEGGLTVRDVLRPPEPTITVGDESTISLGRHRWQVVHTPGHADDHMCLWNPELGVLFSGDHVLPTITPHIGGFSANDDPLADFLASLEKVGGMDGVTLVLPAHGDPFTNLTERTRSIADHHHERLDRVREIGGEIGRAPVETFMRMLFRERSWGPLAASETFAHLEYLRLHGGADRTEIDGLAIYEL